MLYVIFCTDKPDSQQVRIDNRPAHVDYLKGSTDRLRIAGPTVTDDGEGMTGSMLVIEADSEAAAAAWANGDPFAQAGLFESVVVRPWKWTFGNPDA
jgi:hypothetical protein